MEVCSPVSSRPHAQASCLTSGTIQTADSPSWCSNNNNRRFRNICLYFCRLLFSIDRQIVKSKFLESGNLACRIAFLLRFVRSFWRSVRSECTVVQKPSLSLNSCPCLPFRMYPSNDIVTNRRRKHQGHGSHQVHTRTESKHHVKAAYKFSFSLLIGKKSE